MNPKVSIVIPAHNEEASLAATLEKVLALKYPCFEVIVVDNASTDRTAEIASRYPVRLVREEQKGLLHARERGRVEATGDIIANIDADCLPDARWLDRGVRRFDDERIVGVSGPYYYFDGQRTFRNISLFVQKYLYALTSRVMQFFGRTGILIGGNTLIRADALRAAGGYDTSIIFYGEDTNTARKLSGQGKTVFMPDFVMPTSARRFKSEGMLRVTGLYLYHFVKTAFKSEDRRSAPKP